MGASPDGALNFGVLKGGLSPDLELNNKWGFPKKPEASSSGLVEDSSITSCFTFFADVPFDVSVCESSINSISLDLSSALRFIPQLDGFRGSVVCGSSSSEESITIMSSSGGGTNFLTRGVEDADLLCTLRFEDLAVVDLDGVVLEAKKEWRVDEGRAFSTRFLDVEVVGIV